MLRSGVAGEHGGEQKGPAASEEATKLRREFRACFPGIKSSNYLYKFQPGADVFYWSTSYAKWAVAKVVEYRNEEVKLSVKPDVWISVFDTRVQVPSPHTKTGKPMQEPLSAEKFEDCVWLEEWDTWESKDGCTKVWRHGEGNWAWLGHEAPKVENLVDLFGKIEQGGDGMGVRIDVPPIRRMCSTLSTRHHAFRVVFEGKW